MASRKARCTPTTRPGVAAALTAALGAALLAVPAVPATAAQSPVACSSTVALVNGGFEDPIGNNNTYKLLPQADVPGWSTTASDGEIEIWRGSFTDWRGTVFAAGSGNQWAELNANMPSTLYQDVATTPGQSLRWELQHRGRLYQLNVQDVMRVLIGAPGGTLASQGTSSDGTSAWGTHSGLYTVPPGQTVTRFAFEAVSAAYNDPIQGNFLDSISFGTGACVVTETAVATPTATSTARVGDVLTYTVTARNDGGNPAQLSVLTDALPAHTTFVPGSLRSLAGGTPAVLTDGAGDDTGEYDAGTRTVRVRVGQGATASAGGSLPAGESRGFSYQVRVDAAALETTLVNDATTQFRDSLSGNTSTSTSNEASTAIEAMADLAAGITRTSTDVVAGRPVEYSATLTNAGPSTATAARLTTQLPVGVTSVTAASPGGTCAVAGTTATCDYPTVASGGTRTATVTGTVPADAVPGSAHTASAAVTSATHDPGPGDGTASTTAAVTASAGLAVSVGTATPHVRPGQSLRLSVAVTNAGPSDARTVQVRHLAPAGTTLGSAVPTTGSYDSGNGTWQIPVLAAGATATLDVTLTPSAPGTLTAVAGILSSDTADPDPGDDTGFVDVHVTAAPTPTPAPVGRLGGPDRVTTGVTVTRDAFPAPRAATAAVLATSARFADSIGGARLAGHLRAPLLLNPAEELHPAVAEELRRVVTPGGTVYLLGGESALSAQVHAAVERLDGGYRIVRVGGADRYETATAIAERLRAHGDRGPAYLASGTDFPDGLTVAALAAHSGGVVLLTDGERMPETTRAHLAVHDPTGDRVVPVGGVAARAFPAAAGRAVVGADRYDTARLLALRFTAPASAVTGARAAPAPRVVGIATGATWPDALVGAAAMSAYGGPLLLTPAGTLDPSTRRAMAGLTAGDGVRRALVFGGEDAIDPRVIDEVRGLLPR
ncbi:putative repeat protein (TIGR01451 family) [Kineococcus xinjiangensis]|uniref:Putative repeat protein (TIGR01451 family) n=1 Tax=Kineococcus xinjiangensis TaxID=512762 RepID=A0A2S6IFV1_9ACTN|nr:cell wall-binding repeat-containing protein [Kineococcus xinjiangensis]PPK93095.1 putative repeat protein (TIGR01451 family) [Kineococcus xinjiangensis]